MNGQGKIYQMPVTNEDGIFEYFWQIDFEHEYMGTDQNFSTYGYAKADLERVAALCNVTLTEIKEGNIAEEIGDALADAYEEE